MTSYTAYTGRMTSQSTGRGPSPEARVLHKRGHIALGGLPLLPPVSESSEPKLDAADGLSRTFEICSQLSSS